MNVSTVTRLTQLPRASVLRRGIKVASGELSPIITAVLLLAPVVAAALFYVWTQVAAVRLGYELSAAASAHKSLGEENRGLRIEVASLKSTDRLRALAASKYNLHPPAAGQVIVLKGSAK